MKKILDGAMIGTGIVAVLAVAVVVAWAADVFIIDKDGTPKFKISDAGKIVIGATESYVNLVIRNNAAAANNKVDITADVLTVEGIRLENANVSADITVSGAGGLDTGSEAGNTWYYVWVVANNDGSSSNGLLSTSSTSPAMPSGYTRKRRVGAVRNFGDPGNFHVFTQEGNICVYGDPYTPDLLLISSGSATSWTELDASSQVPPTSRRAYVYNQINATSAAAGTLIASRLRPKGSTESVGRLSVGTVTQIAGTLSRNDVIGFLETDASQRIEYQVSVAPTAGGAGVYVLGYVDRM